jgi:hypothetical protein
MDSKQAAAKMKQLIATCTVRDAFEGSRTYINVRTLTNALDQVKAAASEKVDSFEGTL